MSLLGDYKALVNVLEFDSYVRSKLSGVRLIHESDRDTFDRMMKLAATTICKECRGYGHIPGIGSSCKPCNGTGNLQGLEPG